MGIETKQIEYAKEVDDVALLLVHIVEEVRSGKEIAQIASGSVAKLVDAISGVDQVGAELAESRKVVLQTLGYRTGELADAILGQPKPAVPVA